MGDDNADGLRDAEPEPDPDPTPAGEDRPLPVGRRVGDNGTRGAFNPCRGPRGACGGENRPVAFEADPDCSGVGETVADVWEAIGLEGISTGRG
jgi:hypothetical protein